MSYTEMFKVRKDGTVTGFRDFNNAFGSAWHVWDAMARMHLGIGFSDCTFDEGKAKQVWALADREDIPLFQRAVMASTFDRVVVRKEDLSRLAGHMREFAAMSTIIPEMVGMACSLPAQAQALDELAKDEDCLGACWNQTSVCGDCLWYGERSDEDEDKTIPYNINVGKRHWWLFDKFENEGKGKEGVK